jgi:phosphoribosylformimino-5-aminoimidazole carboxamide ribotide isomerase
MMIIPAIDLRAGRCVRLTQGRRDAATVYNGDPVEIAKAFEDDGAQMLHVVDLDGALSENRTANRQTLGAIIRAADIPVQFGGGLRSFADVKAIVELGATRIVIGTLAVESPAEFEKLVAMFRGHRIVVGIDAWGGQVMTRGWEQSNRTTALDLACRVSQAGVERIIYTDIERDGMLTGPNIEQTCLIARQSGLKITASGGVSSLDDLRRLQAVSVSGIDSVIIGKALYEGRFTLEEALRLADQ